MFTVFSQPLQASKVDPTFSKDNSLPPSTLEKGKMNVFFLTEISLSIYFKKRWMGEREQLRKNPGTEEVLEMEVWTEEQLLWTLS